MNKFLTVIVLLIVMTNVMLAEEKNSDIDVNSIDVNAITDPRVYETAFGESLNYRIYLPASLEPKTRYPLILFLHGAGERGDDNRTQLFPGVPDILVYSLKNNQPLILIAPQCPSRMMWVNTPWNADSHTMPEFPSYPMKLVIELLQNSIEKYPVDPDRVYVTGLSMGGFGTWDILQRKPELFAAGIPICGGGDPDYAEKIKDIPIWVFHGDRDSVVKVERSRAMVEAIKKAGGCPLYTEYKDCGHDSYTKTYSDSDVLKWLFEQKKKH